jgi:hypothetical protein
MLSAIAMKLMAEGLVTSEWQDEVQEQGDLVKLFREYYDGFHRMQLTSEQKKMMNISDERLERYNANYCELVIGSMADRLMVDKFEVTGMAAAADGSDDPAQAWVNELMTRNRFDALQIDVREAVLRDGETFVISQYDDKLSRMTFTHELSFNGDIGTLAIYQRGSNTKIAAAVKIWYDVKQTAADQLAGETDSTSFKRVNIYYPNRTEKYYASTAGDMTLIGDEPDDTRRMNEVAGVPVVRFANKNGVSELVNVIPLQDSLNSFLLDLVMTARLTAFSIFFAVGVDVPQGITPGMTITKKIVGADGLQMAPQSVEEADIMGKILAASRLERIPGGDLTQIIKGMDMIINQISVITSTPIPGMMGGDSSSGEAIKQRDVRLLGKLNRAQVQMGNSWEDVIDLANRQQKLFGFKIPPTIDIVNTRWKSAEIRNDADILKAAEQLQKWGFEREALRTLSQSTLANYTEADIDKLMEEKAADAARTLQGAAGTLPGIDQFNFNPVLN